MTSNTGDFVHLHVHTDFSMLDGAALPSSLTREAARLEMPAVAITDHGSMAGAYALYKEAQKAGIKPIIGIEGYLAPGDTPRTVHEGVFFGDGGPDDVSSRGAYTHITMLAQNNEGMHNLFKISSQSYLDGIFRKPRADRELLSEFSKGIIATTGCPSGEVQTLLRLGMYDKAVQAAADYRDIFGPENYFVELMDHNLEIERRVAKDLLRLARDLNIPLVATNDLHYVHHYDAKDHEALLCVQSGTTLNDPNRFRFDSHEFYLKPAYEMRKLFAEHPEACDNTLLIAERCDISFDESANLMPKFPTPEGTTDVEVFRDNVVAGLQARFGDAEIPQEYKDRVQYEGNIIIGMGFPSYFLIVADFINWAKDTGILVGPGRGSVGGSLIAWALGITELDPIKHGLLFERFLNPERVSMPDIDVDFDDRRRGEVIDYVVNKYGDDRVAQIATFNVIKAKAAIKDASRVLGYPYSLGDRMSKAFPEQIMGKTLSLSEAYDPENPRFTDAEDFRTLVQRDRDASKVLELARGLEGIKRGFGMHAAGVIMSENPLVETVPLMRSKKDGPIMTQFEYPQCEALGLIKMDFLGLSNLGTIDEAVNQIRINKGIDIDIQALIDTLDDPKTYELMARGDTLGVFQLDSPQMRSLLRSMKPDQFDDISAVLALYRPGPMGANAHNEYADRKNKRKETKPIHSELAEPLADILDLTHGVIVYQEQVMAIAQRVAGYTLGQADNLRRAMGKKKKEVLDKEYVGFHDGMKANGYSEAAIKTLWDILVPFADYAFNRAHSAGYGLLSYVTGWLKANFPTEYMAALLTTNSHRKDKTAIYLAECRRMGIKVLTPSINESLSGYTAVGGDIRFGLSAIRNVGDHIVDPIIAERDNGRYTSFTDFLTRSDSKVLNKRVVDSLIKAGAFDEFGNSRCALAAVAPDAVPAASKRAKKAAAKEQASLFEDSGIEAFEIDIHERGEWPQVDVLGYERQMLGLYVSSHPLSDKAEELAAASDTPIAQIAHDEEVEDGQLVTLAGLVTGLQVKTTKRGDKMAIFTLEDLDASVEVVVFPRPYQKYAHALQVDSAVVIEGKVQIKDGGSINVIADSVENLKIIANRSTNATPFVIDITEAGFNQDMSDRLKEVFSRHEGSWVVEFQVHRDGKAPKRVPTQYLVSPTRDLAEEIEEILNDGLAKPLL
jgi:DNA polymerase III subunit alpha